MTLRPQKRSLTIAGHKTSISLEGPFWDALTEIAQAQNKTIATLVSEIDETRGDGGLSSAIRVYLLNHFRALRQDD